MNVDIGMWNIGTWKYVCERSVCVCVYVCVCVCVCVWEREREREKERERENIGLFCRKSFFFLKKKSALLHHLQSYVSKALQFWHTHTHTRMFVHGYRALLQKIQPRLLLFFSPGLPLVIKQIQFYFWVYVCENWIWECGYRFWEICVCEYEYGNVDMVWGNMCVWIWVQGGEDS